MFVYSQPMDIYWRCFCIFMKLFFSIKISNVMLRQFVDLRIKVLEQLVINGIIWENLVCYCDKITHFKPVRFDKKILNAFIAVANIETINFMVITKSQVLCLWKFSDVNAFQRVKFVHFNPNSINFFLFIKFSLSIFQVKNSVLTAITCR